ncbi:MAG TPA: PqqD family protein [Pyrinomonadaceae bacterium]|nr:PqqD family protein [Pyrinomonadaceae bacterium]
MLNKQIVSTIFDDGDGVLVDLETKRYYQLNETAMIVWDGLERGSSVAEIAEKFTSIFDVQPEHAVNSVERILSKFQSLKLTD